ncbi:MAG: phosphatase PAP2 family protein [Verrucomicrobia bacterium]|jgi:acid phosphatase (class A)|nr:phosphatase PAP2 family protein [Verrucomicrobiota bacterium]
MKSKLRVVGSTERLRSLVALWLVLFFITATLLAGEKYLALNQPDGIALLPPPPVPNSAEQAADLASARAVFQAAPPEEKARAEKYAFLTIFKFAPVIGEYFKHGKVPKTEAFFDKVKASLGNSINPAKEYWKRERPYQADATLSYGKPESSYSYPSGHSAVGTVQALILGELFPDKREAILEIGRSIGWDRVVIGKHFPTDVYAGRTLAQAIVRELKTNPDFQRDFAEAKAEVRAALASQTPGK